MYKILLIMLVAVFMLSSQFSKAQTTNEKNKWEFYEEIQGIKIFTKVQEFHDIQHGLHQEFIILKFENTTSTNIEIEWNTELWYNDKCINCNSTSEEHISYLSIDSNSKVEGNLNSGNNLKIFKRFLNYNDKSELTKFVIANLKLK